MNYQQTGQKYYPPGNTEYIHTPPPLIGATPVTIQNGEHPYPVHAGGGVVFQKQRKKAVRYKKDEATRRREYRERLSAEEKQRTKVAAAAYMREYRARKKRQPDPQRDDAYVHLNSKQLADGGDIEQDTDATAGGEQRGAHLLSAGYDGITAHVHKSSHVNSVDKHTEDVVQPCECQPNVNTTEQSAVKLIQAVPLVKLVPKPEKQKTQEIEKGNVTSDIDDKYDVLGKYVASKLRQLDIEQRMYVERIIHEAIYEGQMGHLNINSQLVVNTETFVPSQNHDRKRMRLEIAEIKVEKENDPETRETEPDIEERSEDETESGSSFIGCVVRRERLKAAEEISKHLIDVANIKLEVTTGENYHLRGNLDTQYFNTNIQQSTVHESYCPDRAKRKKSHAGPYSETQTELEGFKLKTEIDTEENWNPHETHLDKGSQFRTDIDLSKIKHETNDELG